MIYFSPFSEYVFDKSKVVIGIVKIFFSSFFAAKKIIFHSYLFR